MHLSVDIHGPLSAKAKNAGANNHWVSIGELGGDVCGNITIFCPSYTAAKGIADAINAAWADRDVSPETEEVEIAI